jgi:hypothetical protein
VSRSFDGEAAFDAIANDTFFGAFMRFFWGRDPGTFVDLLQTKNPAWKLLLSK